MSFFVFPCWFLFSSADVSSNYYVIFYSRHSVFAPLSTNLLIVEGFQDILNLSNEEDKQKLSFHMTNVVKSINEAAEVLKSVRIPNP